MATNSACPIHIVANIAGNQSVHRSRACTRFYNGRIYTPSPVTGTVPRLMMAAVLMSKPNDAESTSYTPLSERINQDVIHDNFVPKYSALATAPSTKLVLIGVWMIFLPMSFGVFALPIYFFWSGHDDPFASILQALLTTAFGMLAIAILYSQTRRYFKRNDGH
jgi:hypothetical protein